MAKYIMQKAHVKPYDVRQLCSKYGWRVGGSPVSLFTFSRTLLHGNGEFKFQVFVCLNCFLELLMGLLAPSFCDQKKLFHFIFYFFKWSQMGHQQLFDHSVKTSLIR